MSDAQNAPKIITHGMVLAAGLGTRMRPITDTMPKPMVSVAGKPLLDHALDALADHGTAAVAINVHYLADQIEAHVSNRSAPQCLISDERNVLLDSGGGVAKALGCFDNDPSALFILNADSFWVDGASANLDAMAAAWNPNAMDMLLLVATKDQAVGFDGAGDFNRDGAGRLTRRGDAASAPFIYAGAIIAKPELFHAITESKFSLNRLFDEAIATGRLFGCALDGLWLHVGTPQSIGEAEVAIERYQSRTT